jgi:hypothetical protein
MTLLDKVEENIRGGYYKSAEKLLKKENSDSLRKYYLFALICYMKNDLDKAYKLLLKIYFNSNEFTQSEITLRREVIDLLEKVTKVIDKGTYNAIISKSDENPEGDLDIIRTIYFGGIKYDLSMSEIVNLRKIRLSENLKTGITIFGNNYFIQFYKNYSSFTPLLNLKRKTSLGGGYFLNLDNYGLIIDPGHDFLNNFYSAGRSFEDINGIIVTHFHDDHYADLPSLLALIYQRGKNKIKSYKKYDLFFDIETYEKFQDLFLKKSIYDRTVKLSSKKAKAISIKDGISLIPLKTKHITTIKNSGVGILINIEKKSTQVIITGDSGWHYRIGENYKKNLIKESGWKRILVAHISTLHNEEAISHVYNKSWFYGAHLGLHGLLKCIECVNPTTVILSEIGEELAPVIYKIARLIESKYNINCEVGMNSFKFIID